MAVVSFTGASPVLFISEYINGNAGRRCQIPLPLLTVANGQPDPTNWLAAVGFSATDPDTTLVTTLIRQPHPSSPTSSRRASSRSLPQQVFSFSDYESDWTSIPTFICANRLN
jgi:hypothetical protein